MKKKYGLFLLPLSIRRLFHALSCHAHTFAVQLPRGIPNTFTMRSFALPRHANTFAMQLPWSIPNTFTMRSHALPCQYLCHAVALGCSSYLRPCQATASTLLPCFISLTFQLHFTSLILMTLVTLARQDLRFHGTLQNMLSVIEFLKYIYTYMHVRFFFLKKVKT